MKIYTKTGDNGTTSLLSGARVKKNHPRIEAYGSIDELNSYIGVALASETTSDELFKTQLNLLKKSQHFLFNIGSHLACDDSKFASHLPVLGDKLTKALETQMDLMTEMCPPLKNFILPGGCTIASHLHVARCICRRSERLTCLIDGIDENIVPYLNRLSDYLFCLSRYANIVNSHQDVIWSKEV